MQKTAICDLILMLSFIVFVFDILFLWRHSVQINNLANKNSGKNQQTIYDDEQAEFKSVFNQTTSLHTFCQTAMWDKGGVKCKRTF